MNREQLREIYERMKEVSRDVPFPWAQSVDAVYSEKTGKFVADTANPLIADFIVHAPQDIVNLIKEIKRLQEIALLLHKKVKLYESLLEEIPEEAKELDKRLRELKKSV